MEISDRVKLVTESVTLAITAKAAQLAAQGYDIVPLAAGEPDFDTPAHIKAAAIDAIHRGFTKYTAVSGTPGLKQAVVNKFKQQNNLNYATDQILVSCGAKQSFYNLCQAYINRGDEVIIPAPYWVSYPDIVLLAEGIPIFIKCSIEQSYKITPAQLAAAITPNTKMLIINSPSNPTGAIYTLAELKALAEIVKQHPQILIATDDIYEHILLGDSVFNNILNACPEIYERTVVLNGVSKAYSMTGWRIGYAAGPKKLIKAMENIQSQSTSNPTSISQVAAEAALNGDQSCITQMCAAFNERHEYVLSIFENIPELNCIRAGGAFYTFVEAHEAIQQAHQKGKISEASDLAFAQYLLTSHGVAVVPGSAFGAPGYFRISFATSLANLEEGLARIKSAIYQ